MIRKTLSQWLCALALLLSTTALLPAAEQTTPRTVTLAVEHMTCAMCPITVRKSLERVPGVIKASADYRSHSARVTFDPSRTDVPALTAATSNAGYPSHLKATAE